MNTAATEPAQRSEPIGSVIRTPYSTEVRTHLPLGATYDGRGVNFSVFARDATAAELRLYEDATSLEPFQIISLSSEEHRIFCFWHVYVNALPLGTYYTWRIARAGQSLEHAMELLDPYARATSDARWDRSATMAGKCSGVSFRAIVVAQTDEPPSEPALPRDPTDIVIYEMHVGGFTQHASSGVRHPGTFAGLIEKVPYLKELGITHVEFLPIMAFDEKDIPSSAAARGMRNYWGYNTYGFYAPHPRYCVEPTRGTQEFRECVRALHEAGIGVLLDVVFNHTAEGGATGPTINFKALAGDIFYHHEGFDQTRYRDYTGCGNTVNCNHPLVTNFILRSLEHWTRLGVDGFRFDLASVLTRGEDGAPLANPALTWGIELSRTLQEKPVIAEAWDAAGLYQVGAFPGMRWTEWNGRYRDVIRGFVRGDPGLLGEVATRIAGSEDLYRNRTPLHSINFVTCHDGFTLYDLVSHNRKHNEANGEDNRDGGNDNLSWNCGEEGDTRESSVIALRARQAKNLMAILFLSQGTPMILAGDEILRTQRGNNNAYCQDNELSWFDWRDVENKRSMLRFVRELIALRRRHPSLRRKRFLTGRIQTGRNAPDIVWHGERLEAPLWHDPNARLLAFTLSGLTVDEPSLHVILNMSHESRTVAVPTFERLRWRRALDTALESPEDIGPYDKQAVAAEGFYAAQPRSVVVLEAD